MAILMVEDDPRIIEFIKRGLESEGFVVDAVMDGKEGLLYAKARDYDLILLDLMLPTLSGQEVCQALRKEGCRSPVLMLTAMDSMEDKVDGLRMGADDYLTKPFSFEELVARMQALIRRAKGFTEEVNELVISDLVLNKASRTVKRAGMEINVTQKEFLLLEYLMENQGKVLSKAKILDNIWGYNSDPLTNVVEVYIRNIRRKIDGDQQQSLIKTARGFGYKIEEDNVPEQVPSQS